MAKAADTPIRLIQFLNLFEYRPEIRLKNKLRNAIATMYSVSGPGIKQGDLDFTTIVRVNDPDPLSHDYTLYPAKAAAGVNKPRNAALNRLNSDTGWDHAPLTCRDKNSFILIYAGFEVKTNSTISSL
jgi:hypothetical protein